MTYPPPYDNRTGAYLTERLMMYLESTDLIAITIALVSAFALVLTSASANKRLIEQNEALRNKVSALRNSVR